MIEQNTASRFSLVEEISDDESDQGLLFDAEAFESLPGHGVKRGGSIWSRLHVSGYFVFALVLLGLLFHQHLYVLFLRIWGVPPGLWSSNGRLVVGPSLEFHVKGVSWYGMELPTHCLEGLDSSSMDDILELISQMNFNAIRVPLALDHLKQNPRVSAEQLSIFANPDLKGSTYKKLLEALITKSAARDILILLDLHRLSSSDWPTDGVWYSNSTSEDDVVLFWSTAARLYRSHWNVIGADLYNEPHGTEKWSQWKAFVEKASNEIHSIAPKWTIFAEGVGNSVGQVKEPVFWAENLRPAYTDPPVLRKSRKIVLSPHVYGPSVYNQAYFNASDFPANMPEIWDDHFGNASKRTDLALVVGEFGGRYQDNDKVWQEAFVKYLIARQFSFFYWCLNPGSSDTGGLLHHDWRTIDSVKADLLRHTQSSNVKKARLHFTRD